MDDLRRWRSACRSPQSFCDDQRFTTMAASIYSASKRSGIALLGLIPFCLAMLLGSPALGQSETGHRLAAQDAVEISVSGWSTLRGGAAEGLALSDTFTIGKNGMLDLPIIGPVPAAGLHANELAKLITDRLQTRSGFQERPITIVQRKESTIASDRAKVEERRFAAQAKGSGSRELPEPVATKKQITHERERQSRTDALLRQLSTARTELETVRGELRAARRTAQNDAVRNGQSLAEEHQRATVLTGELSVARADLQVVKAQMARRSNAASRATQAAEGRANQQHELAARERAKAIALEQDLLEARHEIDALKRDLQTANDGHEEVRRGELAAAQEELHAMRNAARDASAQARAIADMAAERGKALEKQLKGAERLARDLTLARREVEQLKAKAVLADREMGTERAARRVAEASLADARRAIDQERHKVELLERDVAAAGQSVDTTEASANLAMAAQAAALQGRWVAEDAAKQAHEQRALERERADSAARELEVVRQERDAAKKELTRVMAALERESDQALGLARDLTTARGEIDLLKARSGRRIARTENVPKARATDRTIRRSHPPVRAKAGLARESGLPQIRKIGRQPTRYVRLSTIVLPDALLPTRPPIRGRW
jgi:hypothetical protein